MIGGGEGRARVSIVVVTYNSAHVIRDCLRSVAADERFEVIVYDNASRDRSVDIVREDFPSVRRVQGTENIGFARAVNEAVRQSSAPLVMLLNPDAVIDADHILALCEEADQHADCVCAPRVVDPTGLVRVAGAGRFPTPWRMFTHYFGLSALLPTIPALEGHYLSAARLVGSDVTIETEWVSGACLVLRRDLWERVGGLSERWFMYAEDIDLCWRVTTAPPRQPDAQFRSRSRCRVVTGASATHLVGQSSTGPSEVEVAPPGPHRSAWVINLYDFYCTEMASTRLHCAVWGVVVGCGLLFRSLVFSVQARRNPALAVALRSSSTAFRHHAAAVFGCLRHADTAGVI